MLNIILACSVSSFVAATLCFIIGPKLILRISKPLALVAVGFLISLSVSHIIPEAMENADPHSVGLTILISILLLTFFEMILSTTMHGNLHTAHDDSTHTHSLNSGAPGILFGSLLHTFCDGLVIASAFLASPSLGFAVTIAVLSHEIAHELGDYAIMIDCGLTPKQAYVVNIVALTGCLLGGICGYFILNKVQSFIPFALALSGASFIYVSLSDLLPRLKNCENKRKVFYRFFYIVVGVIISLLIASHD